MSKPRGPLPDVTAMPIKRLLQAARKMGLQEGGRCTARCPECNHERALCRESMHMPSVLMKKIHRCGTCGHTWEDS